MELDPDHAGEGKSYSFLNTILIIQNRMSPLKFIISISMITINFNSKQITIPENISIVELLEKNNITTKGIAIAINNQIIGKKDWLDTMVKEHDQLTVIQATQGG